jgi:hypothetical protein
MMFYGFAIDCVCIPIFLYFFIEYKKILIKAIFYKIIQLIKSLNWNIFLFENSNAFNQSLNIYSI